MRLLSRLLAVLLGLGLAALGVLLILEVIWAARGLPPLLLPYVPLARDMRAHQWDDLLVLAACALAALLGLLLVVSQLHRRRRLKVRLADTSPGMRAATTRRTVRQTARAAACAVEGVSEARARFRRRRVRVRVHTLLRKGEEPLAEQVRDRVAERLDRLGLARRPKVVVSVRRTTT